MSAHVVIVDLFGLVLVALGFSMAFRQSFVRRMLGWSPAPGKTCEADPTAYGRSTAGGRARGFGSARGRMVSVFTIA